jgi:DNA polymerase-3 subunit gamma/tau
VGEPGAASRDAQPAARGVGPAAAREGRAPSARDPESAARESTSDAARRGNEPAASRPPVARVADAQPQQPVTEWTVAEIPAADPIGEPVPESVEPAWAAPFGTVGPDATVAPAPREQTPTTTAEQENSHRSSTAGAVSERDRGVPVDDYPLDDEPYGGDPYSIPESSTATSERAAGATGRVTSRPDRTSVPSSAVAAAPAAAAPSARPVAAASQPIRRAPVPGRYGEAVVREILGAQFIEETALDDGRGL